MPDGCDVPLRNATPEEIRRIVPVNPNVAEVLGERSERSRLAGRDEPMHNEGPSHAGGHPSGGLTREKEPCRH